MNNENIKYYKVICKCGHVGRRFYVPVQFAVIAENGKEAAKIARQIPRVKHDHKDAILDVKQITYEQFLELNSINENDPYLKCNSKKEQNLISDLEDRLVEDLHGAQKEFNKQTRLDKVSYKLKKYKEMANRNWKVEEYEYCY